MQNPWGNAGFQPWIYFRYAEILLNFAEASNEAYGPDAIPAGSSISARQAVNMIRARTGVNMPAIGTLSQSDMRTAIRHERQIELALKNIAFMMSEDGKLQRPQKTCLAEESSSLKTATAVSVLQVK
ncbi:SusD family protein [compost metagenome]